MNKLLNISLAALMVATCGCSKWDYNANRLYFNPRGKSPNDVPSRFVDTYSQRSTNLVMYDIDSTGTIDEAVIMQDHPLLSVLSGDVEKSKWVHLVSPNYNGETCYKTDNTRQMTQEEQQLFDAIYNIQQHLHK